MDVSSIARSGLQAAALGMATSAGNVANLNTEDYKAKSLVLEDQVQGGVRVAAQRRSEGPGTSEGNTVELSEEFAGQMSQAVAYEANLRVLATEEEMKGNALDLKA